MTPDAPNQQPSTSIERSTIALLCGTAVSTVTAVAVRILMARQLTVDEVGVLFAALAVVSIASTLAAPGLDPASALAVADAVRLGPAEVTRRSRAALALASVTGLLGTLVVLFGARPFSVLFGSGVVDREGFSSVTALLSSMIMVTTCGTAVLGVSRGRGRTLERALLRLGGGGLLRLVGVVAALALGGGLWGVAAGFAAGAVVAELLVIGRGLSAGWFVGGERWFAGLGDAISGLRPFAVLGVTRQAARWAEIVMLGAVASPAAVAFYGLSRTAGHAAGLVGQSSAHQLLPRLRSAGGGRDGGRLRAAARHLTVGILWGPAMLCLAAPEEVLRISIGPGWDGAAVPLVLLIAAACLEALLAQQEVTLIALDGTAQAARIRSILTVVALALVALLGAWAGAAGAAAAVLATTIVHEIVLAASLSRRRRTIRIDVNLPLALGTLGLLAAIGGRVLKDPVGRVVLAVVAALAGLAFVWLDRRRGGHDPGRPDINSFE